MAAPHHLYPEEPEPQGSEIEVLVMADEVIHEEFAQNRADHTEFRATHEEFRKEFAQNRADHTEFREVVAGMDVKLTKLAVMFEQFARDAKVYGEGIAGINQRLDRWQPHVTSELARQSLAPPGPLSTPQGLCLDWDPVP
jgi:hypothetical protein